MTGRAPLFTFRVGPVMGWADVTLCIDGKSIEMTPSYLTDPLGDLVRFALMVVTAAEEGAVVLDGEGIHWHVQFATIAAPARGNPGLMQLTVRDGDGAGEKLFRADFPTLDFASDVLREAVAVRADYVECWQREACPPVAIRALEAALGTFA
jgi:hypothetical protein